MKSFVLYGMIMFDVYNINNSLVCVCVCVCMLMSVCLYMNKCLYMHTRVTCVCVQMRIACHHAHSVMYVFNVCAHPLSANVRTCSVTCSAVLCVCNVCAVCVYIYIYILLYIICTLLCVTVCVYV